MDLKKRWYWGLLGLAMMVCGLICTSPVKVQAATSASTSYKSICFETQFFAFKEDRIKVGNTYFWAEHLSNGNVQYRRSTSATARGSAFAKFSDTEWEDRYFYCYGNIVTNGSTAYYIGRNSSKQYVLYKVNLTSLERTTIKTLSKISTGYDKFALAGVYGSRIYLDIYKKDGTFGLYKWDTSTKKLTSCLSGTVVSGTSRYLAVVVPDKSDKYASTRNQVMYQYDMKAQTYKKVVSSQKCSFYYNNKLYLVVKNSAGTKLSLRQYDPATLKYTTVAASKFSLDAAFEFIRGGCLYYYDTVGERKIGLSSFTVSKWDGTHESLIKQGTTPIVDCGYAKTYAE